MNTETGTNSMAEMKSLVHGYFANVADDKFTGVKTAKLNDTGNPISWSVTGYHVVGARQSAKALSALGGTSNTVVLGMDYRRKGDTDGIFLSFTFQGRDSNYIGMEDLCVYLILDGKETIELSETSEHAWDSDISPTGSAKYHEFVQITVPIADMVAIANAEHIEYRIQFSKLKIENAFTEKDLIYFKGFYNNVFDEDFELEKLYDETKQREDRKQEQKVEKAKSRARNQSSGCYVATLVYGSYDHPSVITLRQFRDDKLIKSAKGRMFVSLYYKFSPRLVSVLRGKAKTNALIKGVLDRVVSGLQRS